MEQERKGWHVGREIPIALIGAMFVQTATAIWWAATLTAKMDNLSYQIAAINADKYTKTDAQKDGALFAQEISDLKSRQEKIEFIVYKRPQ